MPRKLYIVDLTEEERAELLDFIKSGKHSARKLNRARILLHADEVINAAAVVIPSGEIKVRHFDVLVGFPESPGASGRMVQPVGHMISQRGGQISGNADPRHESEHSSVLEIIPYPGGLRRRVRRWQALSPPEIRGDGG